MEVRDGAELVVSQCSFPGFISLLVSGKIYFVGQAAAAHHIQQPTRETELTEKKKKSTSLQFTWYPQTQGARSWTVLGLWKEAADPFLQHCAVLQGQTPLLGVLLVSRWLSRQHVLTSVFFCFFCFFLFAFSRAAPTAYGGSQAKGLIGAVATGPHQSHSNAGFEPCLRPTPQLTATSDR